MSARILFVTLLLLSVCLSVHGNRRHATNKRFTPCCPGVSTLDMTREITGTNYQEQTAKGGCVKAIILRTRGGKVCVDPKAEWVKKVIANMTLGDL